MTSELPRVYLAGPEVFLRSANEAGQAKKEVCGRYGFEGVFPLDAAAPGDATPYETGLAIFRANVGLMRSCDLAIANMAPFRGPSMDVGTAFEVGFMHAFGKPVFGYSEDPRSYAERVEDHFGGRLTMREERLEDPSGMEVERFDMIENLMIEGAVAAAGYRVHVSFEDAVRAAQSHRTASAS